ncbi:hypothetical protein, partial [Ralstonia sp.]|uniref:hypothetical protein n=1 Tax=Ralstonia sp. TaxID=54061 RepID=UPI00257C0CF1
DRARQQGRSGQNAADNGSDFLFVQSLHGCSPKVKVACFVSSRRARPGIVDPGLRPLGLGRCEKSELRPIVGT